MSETNSHPQTRVATYGHAAARQTTLNLQRGPDGHVVRAAVVVALSL